MAARASDTSLSRLVSELWWIGVVQSIIAILFGIVAIFWPALTLVTLVYLLSAFVIAVGLTEIVHGLMSIKRRDTWWMTLVIGLISLGAGLYLARHPQVSFATFILVVGITFIVRGIIDVIRGFIEKRPTTHKVLDFIVGLAGVAAGIIILVQPVAGGLAFVWVIGLYALIYGALTLASSIEMRNDYETLKAALK